MEGRVVAGRYEIVSRLNAGGMGIICEALHRDTGRRVALKLVLRGQFFDQKSVAWTKRFRREARAIGALQTPHAVQVYDAGTDEETGQPFIAMELLEGADLSRLLKSAGPLPPEVALKIVGQASLGVCEAHRNGVLHRDIKPSNLFLATHDGNVTVKVLDFGIAKITADPKLSRITLTGQLVGTPSYASPEQLRGEQVDERSDVWSLGAVLYKALTGSVPHDHPGGLVDLVLQVTREPVRPIAKRAPWVPEAIARIAERALKIAPSERYSSVSALLDDVLRIVPRLELKQNELVGMTPEQVGAAWAEPPTEPQKNLTKALTTGGITSPSRTSRASTPVRSWGFFFIAFGGTLAVLTAGALLYLNRPIPKKLDRIVSTPSLPEPAREPTSAASRVESEAPSAPTASTPERRAAPKETARAKPAQKPEPERAKPPSPALTLEPKFE